MTVHIAKSKRPVQVVFDSIWCNTGIRRIWFFPSEVPVQHKSVIEISRRLMSYPPLRHRKIIGMRPPYSFITALGLSSFILLTFSNAQATEVPRFPSNSPTVSAGNENVSFCPILQISHRGAICESSYGFTAHLDFPQVDVESVLAGEGLFPSTEATFYADDQVINGLQYRDFTFVLRWESTTPDFLQVYMTDILPGWEGKGIPYRLLWRASYESCAADNCETWTQVEERGEYLPLDIPGLPEELAADSNFNGVPVSFWNTNLTVK